MAVARQVIITFNESELNLIWGKFCNHSCVKLLHQEVPEKRKESPGSPWQFVGLLPLFDPPRHDSGETIKRALNLGVNVKMITGNSTFYEIEE